MEALKEVKARIAKNGIKSEEDRKELKHHDKIIDNYRRYQRQTTRSEKIQEKDEQIGMDRYVSAKIFINNNIRNPHLTNMTDKQRKRYVAYKCIVDTYEQLMAKRKKESPPPTAEYKAKKAELLQQARLIKRPLDFLQQGYDKTRLRLLVLNGVNFADAKQLCLLPMADIQELIKLLSNPKELTIKDHESSRGDVEITEARCQKAYNKYLRRKRILLLQARTKSETNSYKMNLKMLTNAGIDAAEAKLLARHRTILLSNLLTMKDLKIVLTKRQRAVINANRQSASTAAMTPVETVTSGATTASTTDTVADKLKAAFQTARGVLRTHENCDLDKLTEKQKAILRISLRRVRSYHNSKGEETSSTRFDALLNENDEDNA